MPASLVAAGSAVSTWWASTSLAGVASLAARTLLTIGLTKLIANKAGDVGAGTSADAGARVQLPPATDNKLPVIYGTAYAAPILTDAKISTDHKTMWYVCALSEVPLGSDIQFGKVYYDGKLCTFDSVDLTKVISLTTNANPAQEDTSCSGSLYIYGYNNGSSSPVNTSQTAIQVLQDSGIPVDYRWTSTDTMSDCAFIIVKIVYNQNSGLTNLGQLQVEIINDITAPGDVLLDYMKNEQYGCGIPESQIDLTSIAALNAYSNVLIPYTDVDGNPQTQKRYTINGPVNTGNNCMSNLQQLVDACDSWLQYSELTGKWKFVINESYTQAGQSLEDLFLIDSSNLVGGINVQPLDLNGTYNQLEIQYPNTNVRDQTDFINLDLVDYQPGLLSPNEPVNKLTVQLPQVNNYVQAFYLGVRRLLQSREDLTITLNLDFSGIQIEAGDVVRITLEEYGWDEKLFRVSQVQETKDDQGNLGASITAFEYNSSIYTNNAINDFIPEANTGLTDPNILSIPGTPTVATNDLLAGAIASFKVTSTVPSGGTTLYMDFSYGTTSDVTTHKLYRTITPTDGVQFTASSSVFVDINDLPAGTYYWSVRARNSQAGRTSLSSSGYTWNGMNLTDYTSVIKSGASGSTTTIDVDTTGVVPGQNVEVAGGTGSLSSTAKVLAILSAGQLLLNSAPVSALSGAVLKFFGGGVDPKQLPYGTPTMYFGGYTLGDGLPVNVTTDPARNVPIIVPGTDPGPTLIWPWAQGTSSTSDGYFEDSTAEFEPVNASYIAPWNDGDYDWYTMGETELTGVTITPTTPFSYSISFNVWSDTPGAQFQMAPYVENVDAPGTYIVQTAFLTTFTIPSEFPYNYTDTYVQWAEGLNETTTSPKFNMAIRNITSGSEITVGYYNFLISVLNKQQT